MSGLIHLKNTSPQQTEKYILQWSDEPAMAYNFLHSLKTQASSFDPVISQEFKVFPSFQNSFPARAHKFPHSRKQLPQSLTITEHMVIRWPIKPIKTNDAIIACVIARHQPVGNLPCRLLKARFISPSSNSLPLFQLRISRTPHFLPVAQKRGRNEEGKKRAAESSVGFSSPPPDVVR